MANNPKKIILYPDPQDDEAWVCEHVEYSSGIAWPGRVLLCEECSECANAEFVDESGQPVMAVDEPEGWREHILHGKPLPGKAAKAGK